jgi:hypothetical protein
MGTPYDFKWFPNTLQWTYLRIALNAHRFCQGYPLWSRKMSIHVAMDTTEDFIGFPSFRKGTPYDFIWFPYILQWTPIQIWLDSQKTFCKGHPLGFHWTPIKMPLTLPDTLRWVPHRINFIVFMYFARNNPYDIIGFPYIWKGLSWRHEWVSRSFARVPLGVHWVHICLQGAHLRIHLHGFHEARKNKSMDFLKLS